MLFLLLGISEEILFTVLSQAASAVVPEFILLLKRFTGNVSELDPGGVTTRFSLLIIRGSLCMDGKQLQFCVAAINKDEETWHMQTMMSSHNSL